MIPDLLAVRAQLKKLLSLAFFQDHCVLISCIKIFGFAPFLLLPSFHCFNHSNQYSDPAFNAYVGAVDSIVKAIPKRSLSQYGR